MSKVFINYPKCSTCKKAEKFLKENKGVIIFYAELVIITLLVVNNL